MKKLQILLSTYNGEKYLEEQLDSILEQDYDNISILIRDDGSKDNTINIIESYIIKHPEREIKLLKGENKGVLGSFMELVELSNDECEYYAFSDQDDVWFKDKISRGVDILETNNEYLIYSSSYTPVKQNLEEINFKRPFIKPSFYNAVVENIATGCTIVFNKKMKSYIAGKNICGAAIHDWWFYIVSTALGEMIYDPKPSLYYRQHDSNSIGAKDSVVKKWKSRIKRFSSWREEIFKQIKLLLENYDEIIDVEKKNILNEFLGYRKLTFFKRIKYIRNMLIYRQNKLDNTILKILLLFKLIH